MKPPPPSSSEKKPSNKKKRKDDEKTAAQTPFSAAHCCWEEEGKRKRNNSKFERIIKNCCIGNFQGQWHSQMSAGNFPSGALWNGDTLEHALRSAVILTVFALLFCTSIVNTLVLWCRLNDAISLYLISLSMADLLCALLIIPFSLYSSLRPGWAFSGDNSVLCKCTVYVHVVIISSTVFTFAWISVDRYAAFMKPSRYEVVHTMTRCKCWILFSWITSLLLACPILIAKMEANYSAQLELCLLNWSSTMAYSTTLAVLVLLPSVCTVAFTSSAIFSAMNKPDELEDLQRSILETDQNFVISLFILISFVLSWLPIIALQFFPSQLLDHADSAVMRFAFTWLAIGGGSSKLLIYSFTSKQFRQSICCCFPQRNGRPPPAAASSLSAASSAIGLERATGTCLPKSGTAFSGTKIHHHGTIVTANSPMASFLSPIDYGSFGLGPPIGSFHQNHQILQQNHHPNQNSAQQKRNQQHQRNN